MIKETLRGVKRYIKKQMIPFAKMCFYNTVCKWWIELFGTRDKRNMKYHVSLCLIFKNEAPFLKEWLDYHLTVGVDHFYLYNNNSDDNYKEVLAPYIQNGTVTLIDWPYEKAQFKAYKHCYDTYRNESNWISFLDADEFFVPKYALTIKDWLKDFEKYPSIIVNWLIFGTGGSVNHDFSKNVIEQYHTCWENLYMYGKCFLNTRYNIASYDNLMHHHTRMKIKIGFFNVSLPSINQFKRITVPGCKHLNKRHTSEATMFCNHYYTKAWDIYRKKMEKTDVLFGDDNPRSKMGQFYKMENYCISQDYTISRFLIRMKLLQGVLK